MRISRNEMGKERGRTRGAVDFGCGLVEYLLTTGRRCGMSTESATNKFTLEYLKTIGIINNNPLGRGFAHPVDLTVSEDGRIFVMNRHAGFTRVGVCTLDEDYLYEFGSYGHGDGQFWLPTAVAMDSQERVYVADEYHQSISIFDSLGSFVGKWGVFGSGDGEINGPSGLVVDAEDNVFVVDQNNNRIQKFAPDGKYLTAFGTSNDGAGGLHLPSDVAVDKYGDVYVTDWWNCKVEVYDAEGGHLTTFVGDAEKLSKWAQDYIDENPDYKKARMRARSLEPERLFYMPVAVEIGDDGLILIV